MIQHTWNGEQVITMSLPFDIEDINNHYGKWRILTLIDPSKHNMWVHVHEYISYPSYRCDIAHRKPETNTSGAHAGGMRSVTGYPDNIPSAQNGSNVKTWAQSPCCFCIRGFCPGLPIGVRGILSVIPVIRRLEEGHIARKCVSSLTISMPASFCQISTTLADIRQDKGKIHVLVKSLVIN